VYVYSFNGKVGIKTATIVLMLTAASVGLIVIFHEELAITLERLITFDTGTKSIKYRIDSISFALRNWKDDIFFGTGIDSIMYLKDAPGGHVHNVVLEAIIELGLLGGLPFIFFFGLAFYCFHILLRRSIRTFNPLSLWFCMIFLIFFIFSLFSGSLSQIRPLWILMALVVSICLDYEPVKNQRIDLPF
jgi:O-antigen ligase